MITYNSIPTSFKGQQVFAGLLAAENIFIEYSKNAKTASIDTETRRMVLPVYEGLSQTIVDMYTAHEIAHVLFTSPSGESVNSMAHEIFDSVMKNMVAVHGDAANIFTYESCKPTVVDFLNIVEDIRVERLICEKYKGLHRLFAAAYSELFDKNLGDWYHISLEYFDSTDDKYQAFVEEFDTNPISRYSFMFSRINFIAKFKNRAILPLMYRLDDQETDLYNDMRACNTFDEVKSLVVRIITDMLSTIVYDMEKIRKEQEAITAELLFDFENLYEDEAIHPIVDKEYGPEGVDGTSPVVPFSREVPEIGNEAEEAAEKNAQKTYTDTEIVEALVRSGAKTLNLDFRERLASFAGKTERLSFNIPAEIPEGMIVDWRTIKGVFTRFYDSVNHPGYQDECNDRWKEYIKSSKSKVDFMSAEFMAKRSSIAYARTQISPTGRLNMKKLAHYRTRNDIFLNTAITDNAKSHGAVVMLDWSGSMQDTIYEAVQQMIDFVWFCRRCSIPCRVFAFSSWDISSRIANNENPGRACDRNSDLYNTKTASDARYSRISLIELFGQNMNDGEFFEMAKHWLAVSKRLTYASDYGLSKTNNQHVPYYLSLTATPMYQAMIASVPLLRKLSNVDKCQKTCLFVISDGEDNVPFYYGSEYEYAKVFLRDPVTGNELLYNNNFHRSDPGTIAKFVRDCTGANTINIHILPNDGQRKVSHQVESLVNRWRATLPVREVGAEKRRMATQVQNLLKTDGLISLESTGWNSCVLIVSDNILMNIFDKLKALEIRSKQGLAKNFMLDLKKSNMDTNIVRIIVNTLNTSLTENSKNEVMV